jgi:hypothetical protein
VKIKAAVIPVALALAPIPIIAEEKQAEAPPAPKLADVPRNLAEMLTVALRSNPEILQAEAKVRRAEADLNQVRLKVTEAVVTAFHEREKQEAAIRATEQTFANARKMARTGTVSQTETIAAERAYVEERAKHVQNEARARYLLGLGVRMGGESAAGSEPPLPERPRRARPPIPEKYRQALEKKLSRPMELVSAETLAAFLQEELQTQVINVLGNHGCGGFGVKLENETLRVALTAAHDVCGFVFVFRDYGILLTNGQGAATTNAPTFPEDIPLRQGESR